MSVACINYKAERERERERERVMLITFYLLKVLETAQLSVNYKLFVPDCSKAAHFALLYPVEQVV